MPDEIRPGMDHAIYSWYPLPNRPPLHWPNDARLAIVILASLHRYDWRIPPDAYKSPDLPGGIGTSGLPFPDVYGYTSREYGQRVGFYRVMRILDDHGVRASLALNAALADDHPEIIEASADRGWEILAHGLSVTRMITSRMSEDEEEEYVAQSIKAIERKTGTRPVGWVGPEYGESGRTTQLLAAQGIEYVCDWANDDQPYRMNTRNGTLYSLPVNLELADTFSHWRQRIQIDQYAQMVMDAFDVLYREGRQSGRLLVWHIHPWLIGHPWRSKYLDRVLTHIGRVAGVWNATGSEVIDWFKSQPQNSDRQSRGAAESGPNRE